MTKIETPTSDLGQAERPLREDELREDELDTISGGRSKTLGGRARIIDGRFQISA